MNRQQPHTIWGFAGGAVVKNPSASAGDARDVSLIPALGRSPRGGNDNPPQVFLHEKFYGQRSLKGYSPQGCKESHVTEHKKDI